MSGLFYAIFSAATYGVMSFLVHWNPRAHPVEQLIWLRSVLCVLILFPFCAKELGKYFRPDALALWGRSLAGSGGIICYYYTLQGTASANANLLFSSSPIFVVILAWIFLKERITRLEGLGIACILLGNFLLYLPTRAVMPAWVWGLGCAGALFASLAFLSLGAATKKYSSALIVFGFSFCSGLMVLFLPGKAWLPLTLTDTPFLLAVSGLGLISQVTATLSFAKLKSSIATSVGRSSILFSGVLDIAIARYQPHILEWLSYLVVLLGVYLAHKKPGTHVKPN